MFPLFKLFKKDIIKFAWNHIKADDSATRFWAYINICRFVASFDSPPKIIIQVRSSALPCLSHPTWRLFTATPRVVHHKIPYSILIISPVQRLLLTLKNFHTPYLSYPFLSSSLPSSPLLQVYVALLRSFHPEGRELIRRALDTLVPVLPARLLPEDFYKVVKWTKKILADDGYSMPQLCHIWHMIIRFSDVFYLYRSQLVPQMLNAITRIGLSANAAPEFRLVAVAVADLVISWEIKKPDRMPVFMTGNAPPTMLTPPLPTVRKRLPSEETASLTQVPKTQSDVEPGENKGSHGEESERSAKRSRHEPPDAAVLGGPGSQFLAKRAERETDTTSSDATSTTATVSSTDPAPSDSRKRRNSFVESSVHPAASEGPETQIRASGSRPPTGPQSGPPAVSNEREGADESYTLPKALVQVLANFVMRLCLFASDNSNAVVSKLSSRCLRLFEKMSALPAMKSVPLPYFERLLQNAMDGFNLSTAPAVPFPDPAAGPGQTPAAAPAEKPSAKPTQGSSSSNSRATPQGFSDTMLCNFLDIASSSLVCVGGPNKLFEQNAFLLKDLHGPVFASESLKVHESYRKFLKTVSY